MTAHDRPLELAAAAIDFPLSRAESRELDEHLAACAACRRAAADLRADAAIVRTPVMPLSAQRSQVILAGARRRRRSSPPLRLLAIAALFALGTGAALAIGAQLLQDDPPETPPTVVRPSPSASADPSAAPSPSAEPSGSPTAPPTQLPSGPTPSAPASEPPVPGGPIQADARDIGTLIRIAPAMDGGAFVTVPTGDETALYRLEPDGSVRTGWPVRLPNSPCEAPLVAPDGSVRVVCWGMDQGEIFPAPQRAFAFSPDGQSLTGWPVEVECCAEELRLVDDRMMFVARTYTTDTEVPGEPIGTLRVVSIEGDGTVQLGVEQPLMADHVSSTLAPDGTGYSHRVVAGGRIAVTAFDVNGARDGWPVELPGWSSPPAFLPDGRIAFTATEDGSTVLLILGVDGQEVGIGNLPFELTIPWSGAGDYLYAPMLVAGDGTLRIVGADSRLWAVDPDDSVLDGWPWIAGSRLQQEGFIPPGDTGGGQADVPPVIGPEGQLVLAVEATDSGGALVAVNADGTVREGWPVTLNRPGSAVWEVAMDDSGATFALAIEPEGDAGFSGTILRLEPDSTVSWATTLVEP